MKELPDDRIENIKNLMEKGKTLPDHYKEFLISQLERLKISLLFDTKPVPAEPAPYLIRGSKRGKEYELIYAYKEREEDILADTMAIPLQKVKTVRNNLII